MVMDEYFMDLTNEKSSILAKAFELSVKKGYDSKKFVEDIMLGEDVEYIMVDDEVPDWCDGYFLLSTFEMVHKFKKGRTVDPYKMWFLGYLYRYWMRVKNIGSKEVYSILPFDKYLERFEFYHTQGWNYIIQDATERKEN